MPTHRYSHMLDWMLYRHNDGVLIFTSVSQELTPKHRHYTSASSVPNPVLVYTAKCKNSLINRFQPMTTEDNFRSMQNPIAEQIVCLFSLLHMHIPTTISRITVQKCAYWCLILIWG